MSVTDSQKDLVSVSTVTKSSDEESKNLWSTKTFREKLLLVIIATLVLLCLTLVIALIFVGSQGDSNDVAEVCITEGCVGELT